MHIAMAIFKYFPFGGLERDMLRMAESAAKRGHRVVIHTSKWEDDAPLPENIEKHRRKNYAAKGSFAAVAREITAPCADRVRCHAGDYHTDVWPAAAYDAVTLFGCLHQESPEAIVDILRRAAAALRPGGTLYVLDMMTGPDRTSPPFSALFAINMALTTQNGWVFSTEDLRGWCAAAGLGGFTCAPVPPPMPHHLAKATK